MRIESIIAAVARYLVAVRVRTIFGAESFVNAMCLHFGRWMFLGSLGTHLGEKRGLTTDGVTPSCWQHPSCPQPLLVTARVAMPRRSARPGRA